MIGDQLARIARRVVRDDSYGLMVAPAVADLQFESRAGWFSTLRGYLGVWRALCGAIAIELAADARRTLSNDGARLATTQTTVMVGTLFGLQATLFAANFWHEWRLNPVLMLLIAPSILGSVLPVGAFTSAAVLSDKPYAHRTVILASIVAAVLIFLFIDQGVTRFNQQFREADAAAGGPGTIAPGSRELPLADLYARGTRQDRIDLHSRLAICASTIGWAWLGLSLTRIRRRWLVAVGVVAYAGYIAAYSAVPIMAITLFRGRLPIWSAWGAVAVLFIAAYLAQRLARRRLPAHA